MNVFSDHHEMVVPYLLIDVVLDKVVDRGQFPGAREAKIHWAEETNSDPDLKIYLEVGGQ